MILGAILCRARSGTCGSFPTQSTPLTSDSVYSYKQANHGKKLWASCETCLVTSQHNWEYTHVPILSASYFKTMLSISATYPHKEFGLPVGPPQSYSPPRDLSPCKCYTLTSQASVSRFQRCSWQSHWTAQEDPLLPLCLYNIPRPISPLVMSSAAPRSLCDTLDFLIPQVNLMPSPWTKGCPCSPWPYSLSIAKKVRYAKVAAAFIK